ncbi:MAG TPA: hypothetical protein VF507_04200, partial [Pyrinomonadaceae bacterium]
ELVLYDYACAEPKTWVLADFTPATRLKLIMSIDSLHRGNIWARVILNGLIEKVSDEERKRVEEGAREYNRLVISPRYRLLVTEVESVEAMPEGARYPE